MENINFYFYFMLLIITFLCMTPVKLYYIKSHFNKPGQRIPTGFSHTTKPKSTVVRRLWSSGDEKGRLDEQIVPVEQ